MEKSRGIIMYHAVTVYLNMRPSNHTRMSYFSEASRHDKGMVVCPPKGSHQNSKRCRSRTQLSYPPIIIPGVDFMETPACNAAEAVAVNVQQEELTNTEDSIECHWPVHCHHTNQTHVLH